MKLSNKLYRVQISSIEEGVEFPNYDSKKVVATDALAAAKKVRLVKTKMKKTFIESIEKVSEIDKL